MTRLAVIAAIAATLVAGPAAGQPRSGASSVEVAGVVSQASDGPIFFGRSGQIYQPAGDTTWRRRALGGVASEVSGVVRTESGVLFAAGTSTPLFRREGELWFTHELPNRGPLTLSTGGGLPVLGVGRHIYLLRGDDWTRTARAPDDIAALWANDKSRIYVATRSGKLLRGSGRQFRPIDHPLDDDDGFTGFIGRPGNELYAVSASGRIVQVGSSRAKEVSVPDSLADARIEALGFLPDGTPAAAMTLPAGERDEADEDDRGDLRVSAWLVALREGALAVEAELPRMATPADPIAAIGARDGAAVIATRRGVVAIRGENGWSEGVVSAAPPQSPKRYEGAAPARSP